VFSSDVTAELGGASRSAARVVDRRRRGGGGERELASRLFPALLVVITPANVHHKAANSCYTFDMARHLNW